MDVDADESFAHKAPHDLVAAGLPRLPGVLREGGEAVTINRAECILDIILLFGLFQGLLGAFLDLMTLKNLE